MQPVKLSRAVIASAIITVVVVVFLTVFADLHLAFKDLLKNTFTHHWVGKGVLAAAVFLLTGVLANTFGYADREENLPAFLQILSWSAGLGTVIIFAFFLYEAFLK